MPSQMILRLGSHAEKDYLIKTLGLFSGSIVGANLLETTPGATVSLAWKILSADKSFLIDPMTYLFAVDLEYISSETKDRKTGRLTKGLKKSFSKMCKEFGEPFESVIIGESRSLVPEDLADPSTITQVCESLLAYQAQRMRRICEGDPQLSEISEIAAPSAVFCPYFYIPGDGSEASAGWEDVNMRLIEEFGKIATPLPKFAILCVDRKLLRDLVRMRSLLVKVVSCGYSGCWLWVNAFREEEIREDELNSLVLLTKQANTYSIPLWNMHGGFLSCLLSKYGMAGFSHSIGYGESKDVLPVSGGALPTVAYHFNPLHVKASVPEIERAFSSIGVSDAASFHQVICDCTICKGVLNGDIRNFRKFGEPQLKPGNTKQSQTSESAKLCRFHFLLARRKELDLVNRSSLEQLNALLSQTINEYGKLAPYIELRRRADAIQRWVKAL